MNKKTYHLIACNPGDRVDNMISGSADIFQEYYSYTSESPASSLYDFSKCLGCTNQLRVLLHKLLRIEFARLK